MIFSEICIKRPVFATVLSLILIVFGIIGYLRLPVRELPKVELPVVSISTELRGASPEIVEREVTNIIEDEIGTVEGIKHVTSVSATGASLISVEFKLDRDINIAAQDVRDKVSRIRWKLPNDIEEPNIEKLDMDSFPIMWIAASSTKMTQREVSHFVDEFLKEQIQKVPGVGSVFLGGEKRLAMRIWLDPDKLAARNITVKDVSDALENNNVELPSGRIESRNREFIVKTEGSIKSAAGFDDLVVKYKNGSPIRIKDVGFAKEGVKWERNLARFSGNPTVGLGILKQSEANLLDVADGVKKKLKEVRGMLPDGFKLQIAHDSSRFVKQSIAEVKETLIIAGILVLLVIFVFLRSVRSTFIPAVAMPISIIATFAVMYFLGFTLNNFTLLGLILAIGVVVDDSIVMLENIFRHMELGEPRIQAANKGSHEITFAIIATSLTLIAVFLPVAFMEGQIGRFFYEFGISVAVAVAISSFVALTLSPMLCSRFLKVSKKHGVLYNLIESAYKWLENVYKNLLGKALKHQVWILVIGGVSFVVGVYLFSLLGKEFVPSEDRGSFLIILEAPEGSTLEYTDKYLREVENILKEDPAVDRFFAALGLPITGIGEVNRGVVFSKLVDRSKRDHQSVFIRNMRKKLFAIPGINAFAITFNPMSTGASKTFEYILTGSDFEELQKSSIQFLDKLKEYPQFIGIDSDLKVNKPEINIYIDREKASRLDISIKTIANTLNTLLVGNDFTKFKTNGERYDVILQVLREKRLTPEIIKCIYVGPKDNKNGDKKLVNLADLIRMEESVGPSEIHHYDGSRSVKIDANLQGITLDDAIAIADDIGKEVLPPTITTQLTGEAEEMKESFSSLLMTFALAIIMIYLILAAQFESFIHPLIIMGALPLSMIGALGALYLFGMTLNIYSFIGIIMLMGLVTKNSILLVDYTNTLRSNGMALDLAVREAGRVRLRPILMTAFSTIFGIVPIAFGLGAGAEGRRPMGMAVVGGMFASTLLTLFIIPVIYFLVESLFSKKQKSLS